MIELLEGTRTLVLLCAFSTYDPPSKPKRKQLPTLERVEPTLQRLHQLLASDRYSAQGIQPVALLNPSKRELLEQLEAIRDALSERPGINLVVFWSGHGNIHEKSFRLATRNTHDPIEYEDGISLNDVVRESGVARVSTWTLFLDACYAGEGLGDVVGAAQDLLKSESGRLRGYGALCSSAPFDRARDSVFLDTVVNLLEHGPSVTARRYAESKGGGGRFNPHDHLLSLGVLFGAVINEFQADPGKYRHAQPQFILSGSDSIPYLFPNPQFSESEPSRLYETVHRTIASASDLESHFFPKALGIENLESGWHFAGRVDATRSILSWMSGPAELANERLFVLAADGGTGKSALLGRLIALTDRDYRAKAKSQGWNEGQDLQAGTVPPPDRIDAALSLRNLTPQTLCEHLSRLLCVALGDSIEGFVKGAAQSFHRADAAPPCIVLDALDEAQEPAAIVFRVVRPLADAGWKLLVATRRTALSKGANNLVADLGPATLLELDKDAQSWGDIHAYALGRLGQPAALAKVSEDAARLIAYRAEGKFLFARIATSSLLRATDPISLEALPDLVARDATEALTRDVEALDQEFERQFACNGCGATAMLTALAWAEGDGVPLRDGIWAAMAEAVGSLKAPGLKFEERHLLWLLREAGRFIQESGDGEQAVYRLFHKSLVDHFQRSPWRNDPVLETLDERIAQALVARVRASHDWALTNPYLVRHMPAHLALRVEQKGLNSLLVNFDWIQARLNLSGIQALLSDYRLCSSAHPATAILHRTLSMVAHILRDHPEQLIPQLLGRIAPGVPDMTALLDGQPGANYSLPPPTNKRLGINQRLMLQKPDLAIDHQGVDLVNRALSLDGLLERAKAASHGSRWLPELGGLQQAGPLMYTLQSHEDSVSSVSLSADGRTVASGSDDHTVRLWDAQTGQPLRTLHGHEAKVSSVALSADGRIVASGSDDYTVRLWDAQTGQALRTLRTLHRHRSFVSSVSLSADGRTVASGSYDKTVRLWDAQTGKSLCTLRGHEAEVCSVALSADGRTVASGSYDKTVRLWDAQTGQALRTLHGHEGWVRSVALSADGRTVVSSGYDKTVRLLDAKTGRALRTLHGHEGEVFCVALSADGRTVASGSFDRTVRLWDAHTGQALRILHVRHSEVFSVALSANGRTVVSGSRDRSVRLWDAQTAQAVRTLHGHEGKVRCVVLSADGRTVASSGYGKTVRLWDAQTGRALRSLNSHEDEIFSVALSADGRTVASGGRDKTVRLWDAQTGQALRTLHGHERAVFSVALSADGRIVASGSFDCTLRLWDAQTGQALRTLCFRHSEVFSVALSADGTTVASGSDDHTVRLWDVQTGHTLRTLHGHKGWVFSAVLSADGRTVASCSRDKTVRLWDAQTGQYLRTLHGHDHDVLCVALSADGRTVASGSEDNTVRLWDAQTGRLLECLTLDARINSVSLAERPDQSLVIVSSGQSIVRLIRWTAKANGD